MYVVLDRRLCKSQQSVCEKCFATHLRNEDFELADCAVSVNRQDRAELVFNIYDRDASFKSLVVKEENLKKALLSWISLWEEQSGVVI